MNNMHTSGQPYASFLIRFCAALIDSVILSVIITPIAIFSFLVGIISVELDAPFLGASFFFGVFLMAPLGAAYIILTTASRLQGTLGKRICGLAVVNEEGGQISLKQSFLRYLILLLNNIIFCLGYLVMLFHPNAQTLHDIVAKTYVVRR